MNPLLTIGIIMTITAVVVAILGFRRGVPNTLLWSFFPLFHGFHEFADYAMEELGADFFVERLELFFAYGSAIFLIYLYFPQNP